MFDKVYVDGGSREQAACKHSKEFSNAAHCSILVSLGLNVLVLSNARVNAGANS
jgi:hypothetical protein